MDRLTTQTEPVGAIESYQYDSMVNLTCHIDRKEQQAFLATMLWTAVPVPVTPMKPRRTLSAMQQVVSFRRSILWGGMIGNQYDALDRLMAQITNLGSVNYGYDSLGCRTRIDTPGQSPVTYGYDAASRLRQIVQGTQAVDIQHDAVGRRTLLTLQYAVSTEYQYDPVSSLSALIYRNPLGTLGDLTYQYDRAVNRTGVGGSLARPLPPDPVDSALYDAANRRLQLGDAYKKTEGKQGRKKRRATGRRMVGEEILAWLS